MFGLSLASLKARTAKTGALAIAGLALAAIVSIVLLLLVRDIREGGEAIGREQAIQQGQENVDAINKARADVRACRARGGVWELSEGQCREP